MAKKIYPTYRVIRDSREKKGHGYYFRATARCDGMDVKGLKTGDYTIAGMEHLIMVERKSLKDLWNSLLQGRKRFMKEMDRAKKIPARYLVIEATLSDILRGNRPFSDVKGEVILSSLISLEQKYGINVIFTDKNKSVAQIYVRNLLRKLHNYVCDGIIKEL